jgi:uncharacterized protein (DUF302 family)
MEKNPFYIVESDKSHEQCLQALKTSSKPEGYNVIHIHDMHTTFKKNALPYDRFYSIVELCNPKKAHHALSADPRMGNMMPKEVMVYQDEDGKTKLMYMRPDPDMVDRLFPGRNIGALSKNVSDAIQRIVAEAAK